MIFGYGSDRAVVGTTAYHCPSCDKLTEALAVVEYSYLHFCWIFSFVFRRHQYIVCGECETDFPADKEEIQQLFHKDPVPFLRRKGWLVTLAIIAIYLAYQGAVSMATSWQTDRYIAEPKEFDLYLANLVKVPGSGFEPGDLVILSGKGYGGLLLVNIDDNGDKQFATTMNVWEKERYLERRIKADDLTYDMEGLVHLTADEVAELRKQGIVYEVRRDKTPQ